MDDMSEHPKYQWKPVFWMNNWFENYKEKIQKFESNNWSWHIHLRCHFQMQEKNERKEKNIPLKYMNKHTDFINEFYYKVNKNGIFISEKT